MISSLAKSIPLIFEKTRVLMEAAASEGAASGGREYQRKPMETEFTLDSSWFVSCPVLTFGIWDSERFRTVGIRKDCRFDPFILNHENLLLKIVVTIVIDRGNTHAVTDAWGSYNNLYVHLSSLREENGKKEANMSKIRDICLEEACWWMPWKSWTGWQRSRRTP